MEKERAKFLRVKCKDCPNEQVVFERASAIVTCQVCGAVILEPTGGKALVRAEVIGVVE